jgi:hypothetical protein
LKELEYFGEPQTGTLEERLSKLIDQLLVPLENEWLKGKGEGDAISRVKKLRMAILPDMANGDIDEQERERRWAQLQDTYLAQQVFLYPPEYFGDEQTTEQLLETIERYEEDLTDEVSVHYPLHVVMEIGEAIEVDTKRDKSVESDPLMDGIENNLNQLLKNMKR